MKNEWREKMIFKKGMVVQFNENHKWIGSLGIITEVKKCGDDTRYMVGVPDPMQGTAFIYVMGSENAIEYIGEAVLTLKDEED